MKRLHCTVGFTIEDWKLFIENTPFYTIYFPMDLI